MKQVAYSGIAPPQYCPFLYRWNAQVLKKSFFSHHHLCRTSSTLWRQEPITEDVMQDVIHLMEREAIRIVSGKMGVNPASLLVRVTEISQVIFEESDES